MGQAIPRQHPAVVLRSHYNALRALLALVLIVAAGLTATVVILATDDDDVSSASSAWPTQSIDYGNSTVLPQRKLDGATDVQRRYDGGPEEGSSGLTGKSYSLNSATGDNSPAPAEPSGPELRRTPEDAQPFGGQRP
jgi:hypothetical protein